ncbi:MAG TPA: MoaD/ThiS family protein [Methanocella sp.]|nr:MoaD/ThiS family protein [Methanocella sp.]
MLKVNIVGEAGDLFDRPSYSFDVKPGMTVRDIFVELSRFSRPEYSARIYDAALGRMNEHIAVFVNSREIRSLDGPDTKLKDGDVITVLPPMAGG